MQKKKKKSACADVPQPAAVTAAPADLKATASVAEDAATMQQQGRGSIASDTEGSYTGTPDDGDQPVQDADDL